MLRTISIVDSGLQDDLSLQQAIQGLTLSGHFSIPATLKLREQQCSKDA